MTSTPPRSRLSCREVKNNKKENVPSAPAQVVLNTPKSNQSVPMDQDDYSPIYFPSTQETSEDVDVLWDWHSPQTSERRRKKHKLLLPVQQSPKFPIKRHPSNNQSQDFEKLRDELKALQEELAQPDDESCLCLSPLQEMEYKKCNLKVVEEEEHHDVDDDLFNDSIDDHQLLLCTQKVEQELEKNNTNQQKAESRDFTEFCDDNTEIDNLIAKYSSKNPDKFGSITQHMIQTTQAKSKIPVQRTVSENNFVGNARNVIQTASGKLELHRTKSFELEAVNNRQIILPQSTLEEIERKRQEAKARLAAKKKQGSSPFTGTTQTATCLTSTTQSVTSLTSTTQNVPHLTNSIQSAPLVTQYSPEEIEQKRLQAIAKREAKRLQEMVEKNRQEAIRRLQISRSKNANVVKGTLSNRFLK